MSSLSTNSHNLSSLLISSSRLNSSSYPLIFLRVSFPGKSSRRLSFSGKASPAPTTACSSYAKDSSAGSPLPGDSNPSNFCIIEGPETVQDFVQMQMQEIQDNIKSRRNKIFLLMEEVRRLRIQQRLRSIKDVGESSSEEYEMPDIPSSIPFLPHTPMTLKQLYLTSFSFITGIIVFGGLLAPIH